MLEAIICTYAGLVWLLCIKLKVIPWNLQTQIGAAIGGVLLGAGIVLTINVVSPSSSDVRAINYVVEVVPRVAGTVTRVAVEGNQIVKKGEILLEIDDTVYRLKVMEMEAKLADATASAKTLWQDLDTAKSQAATGQAHLELMKKRLGESQELAVAGAGNQYDVENYSTEVKKAESALSSANAAVAKAQTKIQAVVGPDIASVAQIKAELEKARYDLASTVIRAPTDGYVANVAVRTGNYLVAAPFRPAMSFVEYEQQIFAFFDQNELRYVQPGDKAEIAFLSMPGDLVYAKVSSVLWANAQGQVMQGGAVPNMPAQHAAADLPQKYAAKLIVTTEEGEEKPFIPMGARGVGAVYTQKLAPIHLVRMIMVRIQMIINYLVLKLH